MKTIVLSALFIAGSFAAQAQNITVGNNMSWGWKKNKTIKASRNVVVKPVNVEQKFDKISVSRSVNVYFKQGNDFSVELKADDNIIEFIETEFKNGGLSISLVDKASFKNAKALDVIVVAPTLKSIKTSTSADFYCTTPLKTDALKISASTSGDVEMNTINAKTIDLSASTSGDILIEKVVANTAEMSAATSGDIELSIEANTIEGKARTSGDLILSGTVDTATFSAATSGDVEGFDLTVKDVVADASTSGDIELTITNKLKADASTSGDIIYRGNPEVEKSESTGGDVYKD